MSSSDLHTGPPWTAWRQWLAILLAALCTTTLAACQVRPLYLDQTPDSQTSDTSVSQGLAPGIAVDPADTRVEQETRNNLIFLFSGGQGASKTPEYRLTLDVTAIPVPVLIDRVTDLPTAGQMIVVGNYGLIRISDQTIILSQTRRVSAAYDLPPQEFAKIRSERDAENRGARELAEAIYAELAIALATP